MAALQNKMREELEKSFMEALNQDQLPWKACWQTKLPENAVNSSRYRGINALMLSYISAQSGFKDHRWCTFKQASQKGWHIKKGSKGAPVEYWAYWDKETRKLLPWKDAQKIIRERPEYANENLQLRSRVYTVFNAEQVEGIPELSHTNGITPDVILQKRDTLLKNMNLKLQEGGSQPYYAPEIDTVCIPHVQDFFDAYAYSCTLLHECGHATGHCTRLNRDLSAAYGTSDYAREELRAEIGSAIACQTLGIQLTDQQLESHMELHKAYIQSWAKQLENAPEELFRAIKDAEKISSYLIEKGEFMREQEAVKAPEYVGKIDYLGTDGAVAYSSNYKSAEEFRSAVQEECRCGVPIAITLYEDSSGKVMSTEWLRELETPFMGCKRVKYPEQDREVKTPKSISDQVADARKYAKSLPAPAWERTAGGHER